MMKVNKFLPFAIVYFFINAVGLPFGLTYMALLAPFFYAWIIYTRRKEILWPFLFFITPFMLAQVLIVGVDNRSYLISVLNFIMVYIACQAIYTFFITSSNSEKIFRYILVINFILCLVAIPFYFTEKFEWFWLDQIISTGAGEMRRLKMFTYEPSYYALLFTPVFFFFLLQYLFKQGRIPAAWLIPMLALPYILSFSIGVISVLVLSILICWIIWFRSLTRQRRIFNVIMNAGVLSLMGLSVLFVFFRDNQLFLRIMNIFQGQDSSGNGRTVDAFVLAQQLLDQKSEYWGVGPGQIKVMGNDIIRNYYMYYMDYAAAIPNAAAETLALFGWVGFVLRIMIQLGLFVYTRVWNNYYRLLLFLFMFIYQFTGSYITNLAEYLIWILAFTNVFHQFNVRFKNQPADPILAV